MSLTQRIVATLRPRRALLVLDNCEHVVDAAAELARSVAEGCLDVRIVATSRERLGLSGERIITVPPLEPTGSVELFAERARAVSPAFDAAADRLAVEEICRRLDGIPLAIELAAARTGSLGPADLLDRLRHRLHVLDGTRRSGVDRHRTLWSAIRWSHDLLSPVESTVFERLSIFTGAFDLAAAEWVAAVTQDDAVEVTNALGRLAEQSLVVVESGPFGRSFRLLEPIRQFARERLDEAGSSGLIAQRHAEWCLCEVTGIHGLLAGWGEIEGVAKLSELWPNLRSAFDWACETDRRALARDLMTPILSEIVVRASIEIGDWAERLLAMTPPDDEEGLVLGLYAAAHRYSMTQDPDSYERLVGRYGEPEHVLTRHGRAIATEDYELMAEWAPRAVEEFRARGDDHLAERAEINVATAWMNLGQLARTDARLAKLVARYRDRGPATFLNWTLLLLGYSAMFQGDKDRADGYFEEGIEIELPPRTHTPQQAVAGPGCVPSRRPRARVPHSARPYRRAPSHRQHAGGNDGLHRVRHHDDEHPPPRRSRVRARPSRVVTSVGRSGLAVPGGRGGRGHRRCPGRRAWLGPSRRPRRAGVHARRSRKDHGRLTMDTFRTWRCRSPTSRGSPGGRPSARRSCRPPV